MFTNATSAPAVLEPAVAIGEAPDVTSSNMANGRLPEFMLPYMADDKTTKLLIYFRNAEV